ncbi:hypothetical protein BC940DRAFT_301960 [Gongronella butleri]|nr:hypothetical protein BC940DRAFT_301960 [Gongronella butleri]
MRRHLLLRGYFCICVTALFLLRAWYCLHQQSTNWSILSPPPRHLRSSVTQCTLVISYALHSLSSSRPFLPTPI